MINKTRFRPKKSERDGQVVHGAVRSIWQVKQHWARRFDPIRAKILMFKKLLLPLKGSFLAKKVLKIFSKNPRSVRRVNYTSPKNFYPVGIQSVQKNFWLKWTTFYQRTI
jgi:hypothetical protein